MNALVLPLFRIWHKKWGCYIDDESRWGKPDIRSHLDDHLFVGPTGRVFWSQHDGVKELTSEVEIHWQNARPVRTDGPPRDSGTHEAVVGTFGKIESKGE